MVDTFIQASISCSFYVVPYSLLAIKKLDTKTIITFHKAIVGSQNACQIPSHNYCKICLEQKYFHFKTSNSYVLAKNSSMLSTIET